MLYLMQEVCSQLHASLQIFLWLTLPLLRLLTLTSRLTVKLAALFQATKDLRAYDRTSKCQRTPCWQQMIEILTKGKSSLLLMTGSPCLLLLSAMPSPSCNHSGCLASLTQAIVMRFSFSARQQSFL